jgi:hypothetical protein
MGRVYDPARTTVKMFSARNNAHRRRGAWQGKYLA